MARIKNPTHFKHSSAEDEASSSIQISKQKISRQDEETSDEVKEQENISEEEEEENFSEDEEEEENQVKKPESSFKRRSQVDPNPSGRTKRLQTNVSSVAEEEAVEKPGEETRKQLFQRVFREEDEMKLLNSMIEYSEKEDFDDFAAADLYDFILKSTNLGVTRTQLKDKIKRLKTKFKNNVKANRRVSDPRGVFVLCKKLWGEEVDNEETMEIQEERDFSVKKIGATLFDKCHGVSDMEEVVIQKGMNVISGEIRKNFEKKWRKIERLELKAFLLRKQVVVELTELMMKKKSSLEQK